MNPLDAAAPPVGVQDRRQHERHTLRQAITRLRLAEFGVVDKLPAQDAHKLERAIDLMVDAVRGLEGRL